MLEMRLFSAGFDRFLFRENRMNIMGKGEGLIEYVFEAIIAIFITLMLGYTFGQVISQLSPGYALFFYLLIGVMVISIIVGIASRLRQ